MQPLRLKVNDDIELVELRPEDAEAAFELIEKNRAFIGAWLPWVSKTKTVEDERHFLNEICEGKRRTGEVVFGIFLKGTLCGAIGINSINRENNSAEFGYWLSEDANGKGVMTESVKRLMRYCFEELKVNRIAIYASTANTKSRALIERVGCVFEGVLRAYICVDGVYHDAAMYGLLASDWARQ